MAVLSPQCPNCHRPVPADVQTCPHCGVYLQMPDYPGFAAHAQADQKAARARAIPGPETSKQLDAVATRTMTLSGVLIAFYAGAIFAGRVLAGPFLYALAYILPLLLLLIAMIFSVRVFSPAGYLSDDDATRCKKKDERLRFGLLALEIAVALLAVSVFLYLIRPAPAP